MFVVYSEIKHLSVILWDDGEIDPAPWVVGSNMLAGMMSRVANLSRRECSSSAHIDKTFVDSDLAAQDRRLISVGRERIFSR